jgi:hypothetical protein
LVGPHLIGQYQYVASPWTHSKVEPYPQRREQCARAQAPCARIPFRHGAAPTLGYENDSRRRSGPPHDAMADDRGNRDEPDRQRPSDEHKRDDEQRVQGTPPHAQ